MPYTTILENVFGGSPASYAREIQRKREEGLPLTNPAAASAFQQAYPGLFWEPAPTAAGTAGAGAQPAGVSLDPLYRAIQQMQKTQYQAPQAQTPQVFGLEQLLGAVQGLQQAGGAPIPVPAAQYQTPEQLTQLMQTWLGAMQPYTDIQTQQAQEAANQMMQRLRGQWGATGLAASPGFGITQAEEARRLAPH